MNGCLNMWIVPSWEQIIPMLMSVQVLQVCSDKEPQITTEAAEFLLDYSYVPKKYLDYIQGTFFISYREYTFKKGRLVYYNKFPQEQMKKYLLQVTR